MRLRSARRRTSRWGARRARAAQAVTIGNENLPKLTPNWNACAGDALPPPSFTAYTGSNCISFSSDFMRIRVRVPRQTFPTLFAKILGFSNTSTSTVAIAKLQSVGNGGNLEPFAVGSDVRCRRLLPRLRRQREQRRPLRRADDRQLRCSELRPLRREQRTQRRHRGRRRPRVHDESLRGSVLGHRRRLHEAGPEHGSHRPGEQGRSGNARSPDRSRPLRRWCSRALATSAAELQRLLAHLGNGEPRRAARKARSTIARCGSSSPRASVRKCRRAVTARRSTHCWPRPPCRSSKQSCTPRWPRASPTTWHRDRLHRSSARTRAAPSTTVSRCSTSRARPASSTHPRCGIPCRPTVARPTASRRFGPSSSSGPARTTRHRSSSRVRGTGTRCPTTRRPTPPRSCCPRPRPAAHPRRPTRAARCSLDCWARSRAAPLVIGANAVIQLVG